MKTARCNTCGSPGALGGLCFRCASKQLKAGKLNHILFPKASLVLSEREKEVFKLLAVGLPYKEIASATGVSLNTARTQLKSVYRKLRVHSRAEALRKARRQAL